MYHHQNADISHNSQFHTPDTDKYDVRRGSLLLIFILGLQISTFAEVFYTSPLTNEKVKGWKKYLLIEADLKKIRSGESNMSFAQYTAAFKSANPKGGDYGDVFARELDEDIKDAIKNEDSSTAFQIAQALKEIEHESDQWNKISDKIKILENGVHSDAIRSMDSKLINTYIEEYGDAMNLSQLDSLLKDRSDLSQEAQDTIVNKAFELTTNEYDYSDLDTELPTDLINLINGNNIDISNQVCGSMVMLYEFISEDEEGGTLWGLDQANENDYSEEEKQVSLDAYAYNVETIAASLLKFEQLGYGLDTYCGETSLREIIYNYDDLLLATDILNDLEAIKDVNSKDCYTEQMSPSVSKTFGSCDMAHIIWRLNREDKFPLFHNQTRIYGEGMDKCDIMIEISMKGKTKTTELKIKNKVDSAIYVGTTKEVIQMLTK
jgi:hypothetical protein